MSELRENTPRKRRHFQFELIKVVLEVLYLFTPLVTSIASSGQRVIDATGVLIMGGATVSFLLLIGSIFLFLPGNLWTGDSGHDAVSRLHQYRSLSTGQKVSPPTEEPPKLTPADPDPAPPGAE